LNRLPRRKKYPIHCGQWSLEPHIHNEGPKYNGSEAANSIRFFDVVSVPRFRVGEPKGVSGTHYQIDLTNIPAVDGERLSAWVDSWSVG
jgi:hypothetical protein